LLATAGDKNLVVTLDSDLAAVPAGLPERTSLAGRVLTISYDKRQTSAGAVLARVSAAGLTIVDVSTTEADLEDVFLALTRSEAA
jgi:ABC-2 type transport system ATP-binding protein